MKNEKPLKKLLFVILMIAVSGVLTPARAAETVTEDALLKSLPADCLICVRINNVNQSLGLMDQYLSGAAPLPLSLAMLVNFQLGSVLGDPLLTGIDMGGDFVTFAIPPQPGQTWLTYGMLVPVTNYTEFVSSNPNCKPAENGLTELTSPDSQQGGFVMAPAGDKHALVVWKMQLATMAPLQKALASETKLLNRLSDAQSKAAVSAPAWAYVNLSALNEKYNEVVMGMIQMAQMQSASQIPPGMEDMMAFYFKMATGLFNEFAGQADSMTLALRPEPTLLSIDAAFRAKDGSDLSSMLMTGTDASAYSLAGYLDNSNAVNGLMKLDSPSLQKMYDKTYDVMAASTEDPAFKEQTEKMKALTQKAFDAMGKEVSFSYNYTSGQPPFKLQEVLDVKDSAAMKAMMAESLEYANGLYSGMGLPVKLEYQPAVSTYKDATIDVVKVTVSDSDDPNNIMQQELATMYGDAFKYYVAHTPDKVFVTMGTEGEQAIKALIDKPSAAAAPSGDIKIAMDTLKSTPYKDLVCSVNIIKLIKGLGQMMQSMQPQATGMPMMIPSDLFSKLDLESQSTLVLGAQAADGQASMRLALPKQHLIEIIAMGMQIQQQLTPPQEQAQPVEPALE